MSKKIIVRSVFGALIFIFSLLSWLTLAAAINDGPDWLEQSLWSLTAFLFLGITVGAAYLIENEKIFLYSIPVLIILPVIGFLDPNLIAGAVLVLAILFLVLGVHRVSFEKSLRIRLVPGLILKRGLAPTITALALLATLFFYFTPFAQSLGKEVKIPRPLFNAIAEPAVDLFLVMSLPPGQGLDDLPPQAFRQQEEFLNNFYSAVNEQLDLAGRVFKKWLPLGVSVSIFFTFKIIGTFLSWLMTLAAWLVFQALLCLKTIKIDKVAAEREIVEI